MYYDKSIDDYAKWTGEDYDSGRIARAAKDCSGKVLYFPKGTYYIDKPVEITGKCSFVLHKAAVFKAINEMTYVVKIDASQIPEEKAPVISTDIIFDIARDDEPEKEEETEDPSLFFTGGVIDGAGLASCMCLSGFRHYKLSDTVFLNGAKYGLRLEDDKRWAYELIATNLYCKCDKSGLAGNVGISVNVGDSHFTDCVVVDYTTGIELLKDGSNRLTRCHVWGGPIPPKEEGKEPEMLENSVNFFIDSTDTLLTDCYADTGKTGFVVNKPARLIGCSYYNNYDYKMDDVTVIDHRGGVLLVSNCMFRKDSPNATLFKGDKSMVLWRDNIVTGGMVY